MKIHLDSNNYDIIDSGQIFLFKEDENIILTIDTEDDLIFMIEFRFIKCNLKKIELKSSVDDDKILLECYNFPKQGAGLLEPVHIATIKDKKIYFLFWSDLMSGGIRKVSYTLYGEK